MSIFPLIWLTLTFFFILFQAFFSSSEMACVSYSKLRLHYEVHLGKHKAKWLMSLLTHPFRLFGTTLICVNIATVMGSECSRQFHETLGLNPSLSPLSQVLLVLIFGELVPMFAARRYPEKLANATIPGLWLFSKLMAPLLWIIRYMMKAIDWMAGAKRSNTKNFLSRKELQRLLQLQFETKPTSDTVEDYVEALFLLKEKTVRQLAIPIQDLVKLPAYTTVSKARRVLGKEDVCLIYHKTPKQIIGIATTKMLLDLEDHALVKQKLVSPWFVTEKTKVLSLLEQFSEYEREFAIALDKRGRATGLISFNVILNEILGQPFVAEPKKLFLSKTLPGDLTVAEFNARYPIPISCKNELTLSKLIKDTLGHAPEIGESISIGPYVCTIKECFFLEIKSVEIHLS